MGLSNKTATNSRLKSALKVIIPLCIGILLLCLVYRHQDLREISRALRHDVNYGWIGLSLLFGLGANICRGLRWQLLIEPIAKPTPKTLNAVLTTLGTYTVNMALPRAGELWRCAEESRYEKIPFPQLLGTLFMDRIMDVVVVGIIVMAVLFGAGDFIVQFFSTHQDKIAIPGFITIFSSIWVYVGIVVFALLGWLLHKYLIRLKPVRKVLELLGKIFVGLRSIWHLEHKWLFLLYTLLLWVGYFLFFGVTFYAFSFTKDLGIGVAFVAFTMGSIAMAVPVQAGMGAWHFMIIATLASYGVGSADAATFALVVHTSQSIIWTPLVGFVAMMLLPITNKNYVRDPHPTSEQEQSEKQTFHN